MRTENGIKCPHCGCPYEVKDNDFWEYEGETLWCSHCHERFKVVDIEEVTYVTTKGEILK